MVDLDFALMRGAVIVEISEIFARLRVPAFAGLLVQGAYPRVVLGIGVAGIIERPEIPARFQFPSVASLLEQRPRLPVASLVWRACPSLNRSFA
jgi:hypothetical protein